MSVRIRKFATEFGAITERLLAFYTPDEALAWMRAKHPALGDTPSRMIWQGRAAEVEAEIQRLESGAFV